MATNKLKKYALMFLEVGVNPLPTTIKQKYPKIQSWKEYQTSLIDVKDIDRCFTSDIDGIGVITGKISGNLEVIDFDNKFGDIVEIFDEYRSIPEIESIIQRCVLERTQSGGFHIIYRADTIGGNQKLAERKKLNEKGKEVWETIIETRGEGGFCVVFPSPKYEKLWGSWNNLPVLDEDERNLLLEFAKSFGEAKEKVSYSDETFKSSKYEERPGDAYSSSIEGIAESKRLLIDEGWTLAYDRRDTEHWVRPGKTKKDGTSATYRGSVFYVFSSNAHPFENEKSYCPFSILITLKFAGNVNEAVKYLVEKGYGKRKQPSESIKHTEELSEVFYYVKSTKNTTVLNINRVNFMHFLKKHGFYKIYDKKEYTFVRKIDNIVREITIPQIKDYVLNWIDKLDDPIIEHFTRYDLRNLILDESKKVFTRYLMECLETIEIDFVRDDKDDAHFFFKNCWVRATAESIDIMSYTKLSGFIWENQRINADYKEPDDDLMSEFERFIRNICKDETDRIEALETAIGYLLHTYKDPNTAKAIIFCDQGGERLLSADESNGRTGKSLVGKAIGKLRREVRIDARNFSMDKAFAMQQVGYDTQFINFNDVDKRFNFEKLYSIITDAITIEKKNRDEFTIPFDKSPKILISTNYTITVDGTSGEDRKWEIEFTDFYNINHKPIDDFGHRLFDDWDSAEWNRFYMYMIGCCRKYLHIGLMPYVKKNLSRRLLLQSTTLDFLDYMDDAIESVQLIGGSKRFYTSFHFDEFLKRFPHHKKLTVNTFGRWLKYYGNYNKINWVSKRDNEGRYYEFMYS